jgi:hypothetical protein
MVSLYCRRTSLCAGGKCILPANGRLCAGGNVIPSPLLFDPASITSESLAHTGSLVVGEIVRRRYVFNSFFPTFQRIYPMYLYRSTKVQLHMIFIQVQHRNTYIQTLKLRYQYTNTQLICKSFIIHIMLKHRTK